MNIKVNDKRHITGYKYGAPLNVLTDSVDDIDGKKIYNLHFEFFACENGFNKVNRGR